MIKDLETGKIYHNNSNKGSNCIGCDSYYNNYKCKYCFWNPNILKKYD